MNVRRSSLRVRVKGQVPDPLDKTKTKESILDWVLSL